MALPAASAFTGTGVTEAQFKTAITDLRNYIADLETVTPGAVAYFPRTTAPVGWFKCNGAAVSRTTYAALFAAIGTAAGPGDGSTTFNVPDLRGEFIRGLDDGRGVDSARVVASAQGDEFKSHVHGVQAQIANITTNSSYINRSVQGQSVATQNTLATGGTETRPRNIALLACIKY